jgi:hypothetical protein
MALHSIARLREKPYVSNIYKYYVAHKLTAEQMQGEIRYRREQNSG